MLRFLLMKLMFNKEVILWEKRKNIIKLERLCLLF